MKIRHYPSLVFLLLWSLLAHAQTDTTAAYYQQQSVMYAEKSKTSFQYAGIAFAVVILGYFIRRYGNKEEEPKKED